ncbi:MAG: VWA domain-containing protein [Planctomycetes bacterium]|nr:VWA domain-containing protein [Planctomycetota bacterium]
MTSLLRPSSYLPLLFLAPLAAQGLLIGPGPSPGPQPIANTSVPRRPGAVQIVRTAVHAEIVDGVATTTIDQVFRNDGGRDAEGTWILPLPMGAVADGFTMTVGGKEVKGEVLDAGQARSVYESIVAQRRDPGLLEYAGEGLLRARIFPIPANGEVGVTVRLRQVLQPTGGLFEWNWPLRVARLGDAAAGPIGLDVRIKSQTPISTVVTPHATAELRRVGDHEALVSFEAKAGELEDLKVLYGLTEQEFGLHLLAHRPLADDGYFAMLLSPPRALADEQKAPRRFVQFVVDTSGSMAGAKIEQAKAATRAFVKSLRPHDVFQVVTFASSVQTFFERPVRADAANVAAALERIERIAAMGGTNIAGALQQALETKLPADDGGVLLPQVVFVTDGQPTVGLTAPQQILELTRQLDTAATRVFAFGVGDDIDVRLIDDLVQQHRGARDFVRNQEKIEVKVDALCQKLAQPALADVEVRCDGLDSFDVHPTRTRDLFCGEMLQVVGRYRKGGKHTVVVRGTQNGVAREFTFPVEFPAASEQNAFVQTLWARQHVGTLLDAIRRGGAKQELVDEVRRLATRYGIVTPYTSQLIVEEGMRLGAPVARGGSMPAQGARGPTTGGPSGPIGGRALRGDGGPAGPSTPGAVAAAPEAKSLQDLGKARSGAEAVEESLATGSDDYYLGASRRTADKAEKAKLGLVRQAAGRTFLPVGDDLVEQGLPTDWAKQAVVVDAFSKEYFELLRANPQLRPVLALGDRIVFRDGTRVVHVKPAVKVEPKADEPANGGK